MQVLSQLSYNPTSVHSSALLSDAIPAAADGCSAGEFEAPRIAGLHHPGSLRIKADAYCSRVIAFGREYISRPADPQAGDSAASGPESDRASMAAQTGTPTPAISPRMMSPMRP